MKREELISYESPTCTIEEVLSEGILCYSSGANHSGITGDDGSIF